MRSLKQFNARNLKSEKNLRNKKITTPNNSSLSEKSETHPVIDTHAHFEELKDPQAAVAEARENGIVAIVAVGQDISSNEKALQMAADNPGFIFPAIGYHPWRLAPEKDDETLGYIDKNLPRCIALGEVGLDYRAKTKKKRQKAIFLKLIALAKKHDRPIILHCRYSHKTAFEMVKDAGLKKVVFHWFSGPEELIPTIASEGYYMSASPALLSNPYHVKVIQQVPLSHLLLETDAPVQYGNLKARPVHVLRTLEEAARIKKTPMEEIAEKTTNNARKCFNLPG
jgi:TatD DNase family protein